MDDTNLLEDQDLVDEEVKNGAGPHSDPEERGEQKEEVRLSWRTKLVNFQLPRV